jgi:hypothetical protein
VELFPYSTATGTNTIYILIACGFVGLAIAYNLWRRRRIKEQRQGSIRTWPTRDFVSRRLAGPVGYRVGRHENVDIGQINRLRDRGFLRANKWGGYPVTIKGWWALLLRRTVAREKSTPKTA